MKNCCKCDEDHHLENIKERQAHTHTQIERKKYYCVTKMIMKMKMSNLGSVGFSFDEKGIKLIRSYYRFDEILFSFIIRFCGPAKIRFYRTSPLLGRIQFVEQGQLVHNKLTNRISVNIYVWSFCSFIS